VDGRARFRDLFCGELAAGTSSETGDRSCDEWLWRLSDEPPPGIADGNSREPGPASVDVVLVPGAFSECFGEEALPFTEGAERLRSRGYRIESLVVSGRSGTAHNAAQIAESMSQFEPTAGRKLVFVGYSKGSTDVLDYLVRYPQQAARVAAVVSVGGPIMGTPLADWGAGPYKTLVGKVPRGKCAPGDGQVIESIRMETRAAWMQAHALPAGVRFYSIAGAPVRERVARVLVPAWHYLGRTDWRNDGQVVASRSFIPGATALGYVNADHWGLAMRNEKYHPHLVHRDGGAPFPSAAMLAAIVRLVEQDLAGGNTSATGAGTTN
jgi:pimeloyl-ACP methyl ester carboxylesterase